MPGATTDRTLQDQELPWESGAGARARPVPHVVIAWSLDEPERMGECAPVEESAVLGRGDAALGFHRVRPGDSRPTGPLRSNRISREQLKISRAGAGISVENVGKCPMLVRGVEQKHAELAPGDVIVLRNALVLAVVERPRALPGAVARTFPFGAPDAVGIVGESPSAWALREKLAVAAASAHHVLLLGDSGAGKELAARAVHALSPRGAKAFVARNAATFPEGLVDSELFGTARNYPQAGSPERPGVIGEADGGTLFLDEIGELPPALQAHLLRVLDEGGEYQRLGESKPRKADLRVVAATNRELEALKHDFAARFSARVRLPGLEERREDIPLLARHLLAKMLTPELKDRMGDRIDPLLIEALLAHPFTHHLRELERLLWLAASTSRGAFVELTSEVAAELKRPEPQREPEEAAIRAALEKHGGNVTKATKELGLRNRYVLYRLMRRYAIAEG